MGPSSLARLGQALGGSSDAFAVAIHIGYGLNTGYGKIQISVMYPSWPVI
jgi:hypothetical protein